MKNKIASIEGIFTDEAKEVLEISGPMSGKEIVETLVDISKRYLKYLLSNKYAILVNRAGDFCSISVVVFDTTYVKGEK